MIKDDFNAKAIYNFVIDMLFPIECAGCGREGEWLCEKCFRQLKYHDKQVCPECHAESGFGCFCKKCGAERHLDGILVACDYEDQAIKTLVKNLKYHFAEPVAAILGKILVRFMRNFIAASRLSVDDLASGAIRQKFGEIKNSPKAFLDFKNILVVPVPLHKKREKWRGFNQSDLISAEFAEHFGVERDSWSLARTRATKAQAKLNRVERLSNLTESMVWRSDSLDGRNILLIDDVVTTGSTLDECARVLKSSGAGEVWGLVVARN